MLADINERKRAEILLRQTEELYRRAISGAGAVPYSYDFQTRTYFFMGEGIEQLIGYSPQEVSADLWTRITKESIMLGETAGLDKAEAAQRVMAGEVRYWRCDMRVTTREGKSRWICDTSVHTKDESGRPTGSIGILQDVTERKQAEINAVAFSRLGQSLISATTPEAVARTVARVADELFGWDGFVFYPCFEAAGESYPGIFIDTVNGERVDVPSPNSRNEPSAADRRVLANGAELILKESVSDKEVGAVPYGDCSRPSASIMRVPVRVRGKVPAIFSAHSYTLRAYSPSDLNTFQMLADYCGAALERIGANKTFRQSEAQFRLVWESSEDGMRLADRDGMVVKVNEAYCRLVQKTRAELEGQALSIIFDEDSRDQVSSDCREQVDSNTIESHVEKEVTLWNGRKVWFELSNSVLELPGQPRLLLSIFRDVSERKKAEAELETMHKELMLTSRQAGMAEVATSVLHNVGNVLNSVNISCAMVSEKVRKSRVANLAKAVALMQARAEDLPDFLANDPKGKHLPGYLSGLAGHLAEENEEILDELSSLNSNIEHIKEIVAMEQSYARIAGVLESLNARDLVEDALRLNAGAMERHQVRVIRDYGEAPPMVTVDKHKVLQILVNLIRNAKYALEEAMPVEKRMTLRIETDREKRVRISVIDNGIGIAAENLTRIFEHGFTTRKEGHGFGLHSGALAARELDGSLTAHSDGPGKGATFILEFPCHPGNEETHE